MDALVSVHSMLRWIVLLAGAAALGVAIASWLGSGPSERVSRQTMLAYALAVDIQVLLGVVIWLSGNFLQFGSRFFRFEHPIIMILALIVVHVFAARARRAASPPAAGRTRTIGAALSLLLILVGIPWVR